MPNAASLQEKGGKRAALFWWFVSGLIILALAAIAITLTLTVISLCAMGVGYVLKWLLGVTCYQGAVMALGSALVVAAVMLLIDLHRGLASIREPLHALLSEDDDDLEDEYGYDDYDDGDESAEDDDEEEDTDEDVELDLWEQLRDIECRFTISAVRNMVLHAKSSKRAEPDKVLSKVLRGAGPVRADERQRFVKAFMKYWHAL